MPIKMKTWTDLTAAQKEHVVKMANEAGLPMPNITAGLYHTRGDFVSGAAWSFLKAWGIWQGDSLESFAIVAARTADEARTILATQGDLQCPREKQGDTVEELFVVAGELEPRVLREMH